MASFHKLSVESLKSLSRLCGLSSSHTKRELISNLNEAISRYSIPSTQSVLLPRAAANHRVLSVDMGLRNFSYSVLDVPDLEQAPTLSAWSLTSILPHTPLALTQPDFSPAVAAQLAYATFVDDILPRFNPDTILLERQRHRSGGGRNVLEWTLKVNMFENVLYGVLTTLINKGALNAQVCEVLPSRTKGYWIRNAVPPPASSADDVVGVTGRKRVKNKYALSKLVKVNLVKRWTAGVSFANPAACKHVVFTESTIPTALQFHPPSSSARKHRPKSDADSDSDSVSVVADARAAAAADGNKVKLDDLSDSLLQGVAFVQWHQHRLELARAVTNGADLTECCQVMVDRHRPEMGMAEI
ncbi:mitochondrial resolvase Ydc2 [Lipomyces tetrasporus]|uniref:Mitochondrial resolvase Ydc2 n=1 Tax=Lipomyces tetrasporus TaxID=54092 RepID=A0AAD7VWS0_9ASCO|nr:mitochondrial resolvase Ydc2 [Lipomyces tetrasporus]KAJ8103855.1 mitochondrial resolvase Ydc2 [Lipomyces tetrasporus]